MGPKNWPLRLVAFSFVPRGSLAWLFRHSVVTPAPARPPPEARRTVTGVLAARGPPAHPCVRALHVLGLLLVGTRPSSARPFAPSASCHPHSEEAPRPWQRTPSRPVLSALPSLRLPYGSREPRCHSPPGGGDGSSLRCSLHAKRRCCRCVELPENEVRRRFPRLVFRHSR